MTRPNGAHPAIICRAGGRVFALAGTSVREVCTDIQLVQMPGVAAPVEGVFNLRGTLITVVRAPAEMDVQRGGPGPSPWCVVVQSRGGRVGLGVDEVIDFEVPGPGIPIIDVESIVGAVFGGGASERSSL